MSENSPEVPSSEEAKVRAEQAPWHNFLDPQRAIAGFKSLIEEVRRSF